MQTALILLLVALGAMAAAAAWGGVRWNRGTLALRAGLEASREPVTPASVDFRALDGLPPPVQRYLRRVLVDGAPMIAGVSVRHLGTFDMGRQSPWWRPFASEQRVVTRRPGFDWDARIAMLPGLAVRVHDAYVGGEGVLHASLLGLVTLAREPASRALAEGELMHWLAESAWYPTVLLPTAALRWDAVDERSARATLRDGNLTVALLFTFGDDGLIGTVRAEARGRTVGDRLVATPWQGRYWRYEPHAGMLIPTEAEVAWLTPEGTRPYWRGRIVDIHHEFAR
jgi:hypothetical protein